jgi:hypothetical protein
MIERIFVLIMGALLIYLWFLIFLPNMKIKWLHRGRQSPIDNNTIVGIVIFITDEISFTIHFPFDYVYNLKH